MVVVGVLGWVGEGHVSVSGLYSSPGPGRQDFSENGALMITIIISSIGAAPHLYSPQHPVRW